MKIISFKTENLGKELKSDEIILPDGEYVLKNVRLRKKGKSVRIFAIKPEKIETDPK